MVNRCQTQTTFKTKRKPMNSTQRAQSNWKPPRGIRVYFRRDRINRPWLVQWREPGSSKLVSKSFSTEQDQIRFAKRLAKRRDDEGNMILNFDPKKWQRFLLHEERVGGMANLDEVESLWQASGIKRGGMHLKQAGQSFLKAKEREAISTESFRRYQKMIDRMEARFPAVLLADFKADLLIEWIESLSLPDGRAYSAVSRNNWRVMLHTLFAFFVRRGWLAVNPVSSIERWGDVEKPVGILTPEEGRKLFEANRDLPVAGRLALEAFGGFRYSSAKRLVKRDINFEDHGISLPAGRIKTGKRFYVDSFPDNLWLWINHVTEGCWKMTPRQYQEGKRYAFARAMIPHPKNCLRHSFATYHVAAFKNVGETATILCHTNLSMLNRHYRGMATHRQGLEWFEIRP